MRDRLESRGGLRGQRLEAVSSSSREAALHGSVGSQSFFALRAQSLRPLNHNRVLVLSVKVPFNRQSAQVLDHFFLRY